MGISLLEHATLLLYGLLLGIILGAVYDILRIIRTYFGNGRALIFIFDVLFWIICAAVTYVYFLIFNEGKIRIPVLIAELCGGILYYATIGRLVIKAVRKSNERVRRNVRKAAKTVYTPIAKFTVSAGTDIFQKSKTVGVLFKKDCKDLKNNLKHSGDMMYNLLQSAKKAKKQKKDD